MLKNDNMKYSFRHIVLCALSIIALFIIRYWDQMFQYKIVGNGNDSVHLLGPVFKKVNDLMLSGQEPLWFENIVGGIPFYNSAMFSYTYPFYFLGTVDYGDGIQVLRTISLIIIFHMGLLFMSNIVLLRVIGFNWVISILAGYGVILCLNTTYNSNWVIAIGGYALMPLFFAGVISMFKHKSAFYSIFMLGCGSLSFLAKPAQTAILAVVFGGVLFIAGCIHHRKDITMLLPRFILAGLLILGINLPGLMQLYLDFPGMLRFSPGGAVYGNTAISLEAFKSQVDFHEVLDYLIYRTRNVGIGHPWTGPMTIFAFVAYWFLPCLLYTSPSPRD